MDRMPPADPSMFGEPPMFVPVAGPSGAGVSLFGIVFTGEGAVVDNGSLHGRSSVEVGVEFVDERESLGSPRRVSLVWLAREGPPHDLQGYLGLVAVEMVIDQGAGRGWKDLAEHTNRMTDAIRGTVDVGVLTEDERGQVRSLLEALDSERLQAASHILEALGG